MRGLIAGVFLLGALSSQAAEELAFMNGDQLLAYCSPTDYATLERGLCEGYLSAVADTATTLRHWRIAIPGVCVPADATPFRLRNVFLQWTVEHPEELPSAAASVTLNAYREAFPCR